MSIERGNLLYQTGRYDMAALEFREALGQDPSDALGHAMLGLCLSHGKDYAQATEEVRQAIQLRPDWHLGYAALAEVMRDRDRLKEAADAIDQAIQYDPFNAGYYAVRAGIYLGLRKWPDALAAADHGLQIAPDHTGCLNTRAMALVQLGRRDEAGATIQGALQRNPENATTHANQGWALLHGGDHRQALVHFREALRLDPENAWAKSGLVEALKARNIIYRVMLRYFLMMSRLSQRAQWGIVIGGFLGYRFLSSVARSNPVAGRWLWPLLIAYAVFALMTWVSRPLFNLMLRLNRFGRYALSRDQILGANCVGLALLAAIASLVVMLLTGDPSFLIAAALCGLMIVPSSTIFVCPSGWPRTAMALYVAALAIIGILWIVAVTLTRGAEHAALAAARENLFTAFLIGVFLNGWIANALLSIRVKR